MAKDLLSEKELLEVINKELAKKWAHKDCYCRVDRLREASLPGLNWEIDTFSTGGITLNYSKECDELRQNVLHELVVKYDVRWLHEQ
jgi:hypothetical protein